MKKLLMIVMSLTLAVGLWAQQTKQPRPKSQKEAEALMSIFNAQDADGRINAAKNLIQKFADTEFKVVALQIIAQSYQEKNDFENMVSFAEETLKADSKNYAAMLMLASGYSQRTREHDFDKEEKLQTATKQATAALEVLKTAPKPRPDIDDATWENAKKDFAAQAHESLGLVAMVRKKFDDAAKEFKTAVETGATPDPSTKVRLAAALNGAGNFDEAIKVLDPLLADTNLNPTIRQFAGQEKLKAVTERAKKK